MYKKIAPYAKVGIVIGSGTIIEKENNNLNTTFKTISTTEYKKGLSFGYTAALGLSFAASKKISFATEVNMVNMQYTPKKGTVKEYTENGIDKLPSLSINQKETDFVKKYTFSTLNPSTTPALGLRFTNPFGSVGLQFGVRYHF